MQTVLVFKRAGKPKLGSKQAHCCTDRTSPSCSFGCCVAEGWEVGDQCSTAWWGFMAEVVSVHLSA